MLWYYNIRIKFNLFCLPVCFLNTSTLSLHLKPELRFRLHYAVQRGKNYCAPQTLPSYIARFATRNYWKFVLSLLEDWEKSET